MPFKQEWMSGHHVWCNFYGMKDPKDCAMCQKFREKYPEIEGDTNGLQLARKYFPDAMPILPKPDAPAQEPQESREDHEARVTKYAQARNEAEMQLITENEFDWDDDPPSVGGPNFNLFRLWDALVKERIETNRLRTLTDSEKGRASWRPIRTN